MGKRFLVEKCPEDSCTEQLRDRRANSAPVPEAAPVPAPDSPVQLRQKPVFQLGSYQPRPAPAPVAKLPSKDVDNSWEPPGTEERKGGPRVLRCTQYHALAAYPSFPLSPSYSTSPMTIRAFSRSHVYFQLFALLSSFPSISAHAHAHAQHNRRRPGKKMARQAKLCRRSSINGHW